MHLEKFFSFLSRTQIIPFLKLTMIFIKSSFSLVFRLLKNTSKFLSAFLNQFESGVSKPIEPNFKRIAKSSFVIF